MSREIKVGDPVWKSGTEHGYEGPGVVVAEFKNWMGQPRYVVSHKIENGRGLLYHIYGRRQLTTDRSDRRIEP